MSQLPPEPPNYQGFSLINFPEPQDTPKKDWWTSCMEVSSYISNLDLGKWAYIGFSYLVVGFGVLTGPYLIICLATHTLFGFSPELKFELDKDIIFWILVYIGAQSYKVLSDMQKLIYGDESSILNQIKNGIVEIIQALKGQ